MYSDLRRWKLSIPCTCSDDHCDPTVCSDAAHRASNLEIPDPFDCDVSVLPGGFTKDNWTTDTCRVSTSGFQCLPGYLSIFNDDEPMVHVGSLECTNYRKLAWKADDEDDADGSSDSDNGFVSQKPNAETHVNLRNKKLADLVPDDKCLEEIRSVSACRVNIASPVIMQSGAEGHRHAENMRCLFGSTCILFNSPGYLKTAGETIQQVYESRILHEEAARQQQERARCLFEELRLAEQRHASLQRPSFCSESESVESESKTDDKGQQDVAGQTLMNGFDISLKLPSGRISTLSEGALEIPEEIIRLGSRRLTSSSIEKEYSEASELLATHFSRLDNRKFVFQHGATPSKTKK